MKKDISLYTWANNTFRLYYITYTCIPHTNNKTKIIENRQVTMQQQKLR
jgi:hypothetical protein